MPRPLSHDEKVKLQQALLAAGFGPGPIDGELGPATQSAMRRWQDSQKPPHPATGLPSDAELIALGVSYPSTPKGNAMDTVLANVKSAWVSKVNWTLAVTFALNAMAFFGIAIPADVKDAVMMTITSLGVIVAWVIKTWFTTSISAASANKIVPK